MSAQTAIWGRNGENWSPDSILPDFSFAGYRRGEREIPGRSPEVLITAYGAKPNEDATAAIQRAIDENPGKCIGVPAGKFLISDRIFINTTGTVLKGAGPRETTLFCTKSLNQIDPRPIERDGDPLLNQYSWSGGMITVGDGGVESASARPITGESKRGEFTVTVAGLQEISVGDDVELRMKDDAAGSLGDYLYRGTPGENPLIKGKVRFEQVARVVSISGDEVKLDRPLRADVKTAWSPTLRKFVPQVEECGLEGITIDFPARPYQGHFTEAGNNGVVVRGTNCWVRDIEIVNCDSGIFVRGCFNTVDGVYLRADRQRDDKGNTGHHGLSAFGQDCLITNFGIRTKFIHDLTVSRGSTGNVFSDGNGIDLAIDHHRYAPYENLFTNLNLGLGTRVWDSGGSKGKGRHTAAGATFWNLSSRYKIGPPSEDFGPRDVIFVGLNTRDSGSREPVILPNGWYYESRTPDRFRPKNLHEAQLERRLEK